MPQFHCTILIIFRVYLNALVCISGNTLSNWIWGSTIYGVAPSSFVALSFPVSKLLHPRERLSLESWQIVLGTPMSPSAEGTGLANSTSRGLFLGVQRVGDRRGGGGVVQKDQGPVTFDFILLICFFFFGCAVWLVCLVCVLSHSVVSNSLRHPDL